MTCAVLNISLNDQPAASCWGDKALLSFNDQNISIHYKSRAIDEVDELRVIQQAGRKLAGQGLTEVALAGDDWTLERQLKFSQGFENAKATQTVHWSALEADEQQQLENTDSINKWLRTITNKPARDLPPIKLTEEVSTFLQAIAPNKIHCEVVSGEDLITAGCIGTEAVGRGSVNPPALLKIDYRPNGDEENICAALVGKGITFDSGGYSLKSSVGMHHMKADMGGAATIAASLAYAIQQGLNKRVQCFLLCAENLIGAKAYKLGDILTYPNGLKVEIVNTDAEGRIVLADGLYLASEIGAPLIIDAATLTGGAVIATGGDYHAVLGRSQTLVNELLSYAQQNQEDYWPLPLAHWHQQKFPSAYADTANSRPQPGGGAGAASNAAGYLSRFVADTNAWLHLDLAAAYNDKATDLWSTGASAMGYKSIAQMLLSR